MIYSYIRKLILTMCKQNSLPLGQKELLSHFVNLISVIGTKIKMRLKKGKIYIDFWGFQHICWIFQLVSIYSMYFSIVKSVCNSKISLVFWNSFFATHTHILLVWQHLKSAFSINPMTFSFRRISFVKRNFETLIMFI